MLSTSCHFVPLKPLTLQLDHAYVFDFSTSLPESRARVNRLLHRPRLQVFMVKETIESMHGCGKEGGGGGGGCG